MLELPLIVFPVSGVETNLLVPPLVAFLISFFGSMGGVSGAFLILPFQMSFLGYVSPSVSSTNLVYNMVGIPGGMWGYLRERRFNLPLAATLALGMVPGIFMGYIIRMRYLPEPGRFKVFVGFVLLILAVRMAWDLTGKRPAGGKGSERELVIERVSAAIMRFRIEGLSYEYRPVPLALLSVLVGMVGGAYGIGGGALLAPFCIAVLGLPPGAVAGATLASTFVASLFGVGFYSLFPVGGLTAPPDWLLGLLFGLGGIPGMYLGARVQRHIPQRAIKLGLLLAVVGLSVKYIFS